MANAFKFEELDGKIGVVTFDLPDKKVNTLSQEVLKELAGLVGEAPRRRHLDPAGSDRDPRTPTPWP